MPQFIHTRAIVNLFYHKVCAASRPNLVCYTLAMDLLLSLVISLPVLLFSAILHEIAHGYVADRLGDPTARLSGRLTLNPLPHIDPIMTIL